ncbi:hypothetical protein Tco_0280619 [Tanacetum coccineum]
MTTLKFVDTHNMVAFLSKPTESEGFEQIVDFLNANPIRYALKINPTIYTSCIEQLWATVKAKTINEEVQLQALVDGKKVIVTEASVRSDLKLDDEEGMDCLTNAIIFEELTRMGAKTTAWNEFSSTMASEIICLATNQKLNFSKYIFESMVKKLDNVGKFFMYLRFMQVFLDKQLEGVQSHKRIYDAPSHTKKIFGNMKMVGKGFSGMETPLFPTMVVQNQAEKGEGSTIHTDPYYTPTIIQPSTSQPQRKQRPMKPKRKDTEIPQSSGPTDNVADEVVNEEMDDRTSSGGGPSHKETMGDTIAQTRSKNVSKLSNDPLLARVLALETTKTTQANEIASLKRRVKKLERRNKSRTHGLKRLYKVGSSRRVESSDEEFLGEGDASKQGRIADIDVDAGINLVSTHFYADTDMFKAYDLVGDEVVVESEVAVKDVNLSVDEVTLAQGLATLKSAKVQEKGAAIEEPSVPVSVAHASTKDKGKGIMVEEPVVEQVKPMKRLEQMRLDKELAFKLQDEEVEEERLAREKAKQLAQRLQAQEQEELTDAEKARLFVQFLEQRRKHFTAKRAKEKRNRPPTRAQQMSIMCTYLKNMEGWKPKDLKNKSFTNIQELFVKAIKRVNTFVDYRTELVEESSKKAEAETAQERSSKRAGEELEQESIKKQKVDDDQETAELQSLMEVIHDEEEIAVDAIPLATKPPTIVDWKIHKEGKKSYYQIIRAYGSSKMYRVFSLMLKSFDREDLETLYKLVKAKYGLTRPVEDLDLILYGDLKAMFEPNVEDQV